MDRDERVEYATQLRSLRRAEATFGTPLVWLDALADKLEAEPERSREHLSARERAWLEEEFPRAAQLAGYGDGQDVEEFDVPGVVVDMLDLFIRNAAQALGALLDASRTGDGVVRAEALARRSLDDIRQPAAGLPKAVRERDEAQFLAHERLEVINQLADVAAASERERDEVREALRDLLCHDVTIYPAWLYRDLERARAVLEGVERTHALVPVEQLKRASEAVRSVAGGDFGNALAAAARGERVEEWPA